MRRNGPSFAAIAGSIGARVCWSGRQKRFSSVRQQLGRGAHMHGSFTCWLQALSASLKVWPRKTLSPDPSRQRQGTQGFKRSHQWPAALDRSPGGSAFTSGAS